MPMPVLPRRTTILPAAVTARRRTDPRLNRIEGPRTGLPRPSSPRPELSTAGRRRFPSPRAFLPARVRSRVSGLSKLRGGASAGVQRVDGIRASPRRTAGSVGTCSHLRRGIRWRGQTIQKCRRLAAKHGYCTLPTCNASFAELRNCTAAPLPLTDPAWCRRRRYSPRCRTRPRPPRAPGRAGCRQGNRFRPSPSRSPHSGAECQPSQAHRCRAPAR